MTKEEMIWKEIEKDIELYKFYLEISYKSAVFVFGMTGAILSYYFSNEEKLHMIYSLLVPFVMNGGLFVICVTNIKHADTMRRHHYSLCEDVGVRFPYEMSPLPNTLRLFAVIYGLITIGLVVLFYLRIS